MEDLMEMDLYALIGTAPGASVKEIRGAYRKKALTCHPDKNPDNALAVEEFRRLSQALEILIDDSARAAYDKVSKAREQAKLRAAQYDSKRKKLKDRLEAREEAHRKSQSGCFASKSDEQKLRAEVERLQKEGSKLVEEEVAFVQRQIRQQLFEAKSQNDSPLDVRIKIKWKAAPDDPENGGYDYDTLLRILSKYGDVDALVVSGSKKGSALVEYKDANAAQLAAQIEMGLAKNPLSLRGLWQTANEKKLKSSSNAARAPSLFSPSGGGGGGGGGSPLFPSSGGSTSSDSSMFPSYDSAPDITMNRRNAFSAEFENSVLRNMRRAEERKRLIQELEAEEAT